MSTYLENPLKLEDGLQEVEVLRRVNSEFVVKLLDNWTECENTMYFQYEYYEQTLQEILELKAQTFRHSSTGTSISPLEFCISSALFTDLLEALDYLDHTRIVHRRIMPENIYLCLNKPGLKIEVIRNLVCDTSADIYSAGEIAMVMFHFDLDEDTKNKVSFTDDSIPRNFIVYLYKTLLKMQSNDPKVRPTAGQILQNRNHFLVDNYLNINSFHIKMFIMEHPHWNNFIIY
ncbi:unnamed protein product [Oppiella nova]|uniref:Protein kinase domain-containing protein n=1 Tax=Oppiella nova TaxID=334625 RepID=A0A7R9MBT8_9ACAR|nr:unnamed protein product [Oppiella nova]CAG2174276.1 unnamed protein product [Oppiella nova]